MRQTFEKLGFEKEEGEFTIVYKNKHNLIVFDKQDKTVNVSRPLTIKEFTAIQEKIVELGW